MIVREIHVSEQEHKSNVWKFLRAEGPGREQAADGVLYQDPTHDPSQLRFTPSERNLDLVDLVDPHIYIMGRKNFISHAALGLVYTV